MSGFGRVGLVLCGAILAAVAAAAQTAAREDYDVNYIGPPMEDPVLQHSKETYVVFGCAYCHGLYLAARGEATDLMHSRLVGRDENANLMGPLLRAGIPQTAKLSPMPQFSDLSEQQIGDLARWIHYARQQGRFKELMEAKDPGRGDAAAGKAYFEEKCRSCHAAGDLASAAKKMDTGALRGWVLRPPFVEAGASWRVDRMHDPKNAARARHLGLLENYSAADVANLVVYLESVK